MKEDPGQRIALNRFGYRELVDKPSAGELAEYYAKTYYQDDRGAHEQEYSEEEIRYFLNRLDRRHRLAVSMLAGRDVPGRRFLDIGAGEGWALHHFTGEGWTCTGLEFTDHGCRTHNPEMLAHLTVGDIGKSIEALVGRGERFELVQLDNVLEHVLDPLGLLKGVRDLVADDGVLIVEVPNDFSFVQDRLLAEGRVSREYWIALPDHVSYFNAEGLTALCREAGWTVERLFGDYPVEWNLFDPATNYVEDPAVGKACHRARVAIENLLHDLPPEKTDALYQALGELGLGRQITLFLRPDGTDEPGSGE